MQYYIVIYLSALFLHHAAYAAILPPSIDDPQQPFSYFSHPTDQIGVMDVPIGTEITPEGYLYTGFGEMMFFAGTQNTPISQRIRKLERGYLPIIHYDYALDYIHYHFTIFSSLVDAAKKPILTNFVRVEIRNTNQRSHRADFAVGMRYQSNVNTDDGVSENRFKRPFSAAKLGNYLQSGEKFDPNWAYVFTDHAFLRNQRALYLYDTQPTFKSFTLQHNGYSAHNLKARKINVLPTTPVGIVHYQYLLAPHETITLDFKMPVVPIAAHTDIATLKNAKFKMHKNKIIREWEALINGGMTLTVPEEKVNNTFKASLIYDLMAKDKIKNHYIQTVNKLHYHEFFIRDAADIAHMYDITGYPKFAEQILDFFSTQQLVNGNYLSQPEEYDGFGQVLWAYGQHYFMTRDQNFAQKRLPEVMRALNWLKQARQKDELHLIPKTNVADNENIPGHVTGYNFLALAGLEKTTAMANAVGKQNEAENIKKEYTEYKKVFLDKLNAVSEGLDGYIPPTLDHGDQGQDWGNLLGAYPAPILSPFDPKITATLSKVHKKYAEGIMTYGDGKYLHHYLTIKNTLTSLLRNEQEAVIKELYGLLLHTSSTHAGFEFCIEPWGDRDFHANLSPHGWFAAEYRTLLRKMFVREEQQTLHLLSALSPAWIGAGKTLIVNRVPTEFGSLNLAIYQPDDRHAHIKLESIWRHKPQSLVLHLPWFMRIQKILIAGKQVYGFNKKIELPLNTNAIEIVWENKKISHLSYAQAVKDYKKEYALRYEKFIRGDKI